MDETDKKFTRNSILVATFIAAGIVCFNSCSVVEPGHRGVKVFLGEISPGVKDEGLVIHLPFVTSIELMEVREMKHELTTSAASNDLQEVTTVLAVNYRPVVASEVDVLFQEIGPEYADRILDPSIQETVKAVMAQYTAADLVQKRPEVRAKMEELILTKVGQRHIQVTQFNIKNFQFSTAFDESIEQKQKAEQDALKAKNELERVKVEADMRIQEARGRAESVKLEADAKAYRITAEATAEASAFEMLKVQIESPGGVLHLKALERWDGILPRVTSEVVPFIQVNAGDDTEK